MNLLISKEDIETRIKYHENTAQEYYQEILDESMGECENAKAESLKSIISDAKEVEVLDYKTLKKMFEQQKDPVLTIKEFIKANNLLIVKIIE